MDIPTPPASSIAPSTHANPLPHPRKQPLRPGSSRESELITYLDHHLSDIRYKIRHKAWHNEGRGRHDAKPAINESKPEGYQTFSEAAKALEGVVDVIWVSGSPNLQIPYLLTVCSVVIDSLPLFSAPAPAPTFALLEKLDVAFSALLMGKDPDLNAPLPGFADGRRVSSTERVRIKSAIERARAVVIEALDEEEEEESRVEEVGDSGEEGDDEDEDMEDIDGMGGGRANDLVSFEGFENTEEDDDVMGEDEGHDRRKEIGRVFERTLVELGDPIGEPIGIVTGN